MLSPEQQHVVENIDGHNLVVACAGSGKSFTLQFAVDRLLGLSDDFRTLVVTFTNAATKEIAKKIRNHLSCESKRSRVQVSTFHSIMLEMSRSIDNRRLVISGKQMGYIFRALNHAGVNMTFDQASNAIEHYGRQLTPEMEHGLESEWALYSSYLEILESNNEKDFNIITRQVIQGLQDGSLSPLPITHIQVDEFQDSDAMQLKWLLLHAEVGVKITGVGDDDQSIYSFRSSSSGYETMVDFQQALNSEGFMLSVCRRCAPEILGAASRLIEQNENRIEKELISSKPEGSGAVNIDVYDGADQELLAIMNELNQDHNNWAVLARNNRILDTVETELMKAEIPYVRLSGKSFWDTWQIAMQLNMLVGFVRTRSYHNLKHALGYLGESEQTIAEIATMAKQVGGVHKAIEQYQSHWHHITRDYLSLCAEFHIDVHDGRSIGQRLNDFTKLVYHAKPSKPGAEGRSKDAMFSDTLCDIIQKFKGSFHERVGAVIKNLDPDREEVKNDDDDEQEYVVLSTFHSSKGLEWKNVWLMNVDHGMASTVEGMEDKAIAEEERRLVYVAMTRAEDNLVISSTGNPCIYITEAFPEVDYTPKEIEEY